MAAVTIVVPLGPLDQHRARAWDFTRAWWERERPTWPIVLGHCPSPWRKAVAVQDGVRKARTEVVIVTDADIITPRIESVLPTEGWVVPHGLTRRLTLEATDRALAGEDIEALAAQRANLVEAPMRPCPTAGVVILPRAVALGTPGDPRFVGWGGQDWSWGWALETLAGKPKRGNLTAIHLWHPPAPRTARQVGSSANEALKARYKRARGNAPLMRALLNEH